MKYALIQKDDFKSYELGLELKKLGVKLVPIPGSPIKIPLYIILFLIKEGKPEAVIYRYLNDSPNLLKTLVRCMSEITGITLSVIFKLKLVWICHNVDRETHEYYPRITKIRRLLFAKFSESILVTDPLLKKHAIKQFPKHIAKVDNITFGPYSMQNTQKESVNVLQEINTFVNNGIDTEENILYGFVAGSINWKTAQYQEIPKLMESAANSDYKIRMIVIGPIGSYLKKHNNELLRYLQINNDILFLDGFYSLNLKEIMKYIDFYWRIYLDQSIPATIYESTFYSRPILTQNKGFLGEAVEEYALGYILKEDYTNINSTLKQVSSWDSSGAENFMRTHTWLNGATKINEIIK